ncbi:hypothetical protein PVAND_013791 [Polypedilum vanderplanki]|uniref:Cathepsin propeptide inhibitor domain-containing protein n=1 Tax=Polypedilum vanderplanki TaxID=319348 RepID=A0A9J6CSD8_POLVA|nr:hypothetical protein PVAND_013791 [Polypedilum vanderplanki]
MKFLIFVFLSAFTVGFLSETIEERWVQYKIDQNKNYLPEDDKKHFEIFKNNVKIIDEHNVKFNNGESTYQMGLNQFTDMDPKEYSTYYGGLRNPRRL